MKRTGVLQALLLLAVSPAGLAGQEETSSSLESLLATPVNAASLYAQTAAQAPGAVTIVTGEDIRRFGWRTLEDVLSWTRGFHTTNDRNYSYIGVRGFSLPTDYNNRLLLLVDGHRVNDAYYGAAPAGLDLGVDLNRVERIEVIRGAGSALYGSNAMFAVVNVVTEKEVDGSWATASLGSWDSYATTAGVAREFGPVGLEISGRYGRSDGEDLHFDEFGSVRGLDGEEHGFVAIRTEWSAFSLTGRWSRRWKEIPTASWGITPNDDRAGTYDEYGWLTLRFAPHLGLSTDLELSATLDHYDYEGFYPGEGSYYRDLNDVNGVGLAGHVRRDLRADNRLIIGADARHHYQATYRSWDESGVYFDGDFPYSTGSVFVQDEHDITPELTLLGGLRYDASTMGYAHLSPRAALVWTPDAASTLKLVYGDAFRGPTVYERFFDSPGFEAHDLDAETSRMSEIILERRFGSFVQATASAFYADIRGLIETVEDSVGMRRFRNGTSARSHGFETEIQARHDGYFGRLGYTYAHAHADDRRATNSPTHVVILGAGAPVAERMDVGLLARWESDRLTVQGTRTSSFFIANASLSFRDLLPGLTGRLHVHNIFDTDVMAPGGFEHVQDALPQPGRRVEGALEYAF